MSVSLPSFLPSLHPPFQNYLLSLSALLCHSQDTATEHRKQLLSRRDEDDLSNSPSPSSQLSGGFLEGEEKRGIEREVEKEKVKATRVAEEVETSPLFDPLQDALYSEETDSNPPPPHPRPGHRDHDHDNN